MLVRVLEEDLTEENRFENAKFLKGYNFENIDIIVEVVKSLMGKDMRIGNDWYTIDDYVWSFPETDDNIPSFDIYVYGY